MGLQWTLIAGFLYAEVAIVLLLVLPIISPSRWQKFFKSRFLQSLSNQASIYFFMLLAILTLFLLDAIREIKKYSSVVEHTGEGSLSAEMQGNMRLFRAQRNFYICGFALFLSLVIRRLIILISTQATLVAQHEAALRQAQSATTTARTLLSQKPGDDATNDEAHGKAVADLQSQIKELQAKNMDLENQLNKEKKDKEALKSQATSLAAEYDRLTDEHAKLVQAGGDKKNE